MYLSYLIEQTILNNQAFRNTLLVTSDTKANFSLKLKLTLNTP